MVSLSSIQISPRSEIKIHYANNKRFLIRVIRVTRVNPRFRQLIHIARWGNQSSVCSRAIYRTFSLRERHTPCSHYLASQVQFVPTEEQQLVVRSRDSEIPPTRVIDCRWLSGGFGDRRGKTVRLGMQIAFGRVRRKTAPTILAVSYQRSAVSDGSWGGGCSIVVRYTYGVSFWQEMREKRRGWETSPAEWKDML